MKKVLFLAGLTLALVACGQENSIGYVHTLTLYGNPPKFSVGILDSNQTEIFNGVVETGHKFTGLRPGKYTLVPGYAPPAYGLIYQVPDEQIVDLESDMNVNLSYGMGVID